MHKKFFFIKSSVQRPIAIFFFIALWVMRLQVAPCKSVKVHAFLPAALCLSALQLHPFMVEGESEEQNHPSFRGVIAAPAHRLKGVGRSVVAFQSALCARESIFDSTALSCPMMSHGSTIRLAHKTHRNFSSTHLYRWVPYSTLGSREFGVSL